MRHIGEQKKKGYNKIVLRREKLKGRINYRIKGAAGYTLVGCQPRFLILAFRFWFGLR